MSALHLAVWLPVRDDLSSVRVLGGDILYVACPGIDTLSTKRRLEHIELMLYIQIR